MSDSVPVGGVPFSTRILHRSPDLAGLCLIGGRATRIGHPGSGKRRVSCWGGLIRYRIQTENGTAQCAEGTAGVIAATANPVADTAVITVSLSQRGALVDIYSALDGENWRIKTNWLSDRPLGECRRGR